MTLRVEKMTSLNNVNNTSSSKKKIDDAIKQADEMMYYIKKTVKHRYVFYDDVEHDCK